MLFDVVKLAWVDKNFAGYPFEQPAQKEELYEWLGGDFKSSDRQRLKKTVTCTVWI